MSAEIVFLTGAGISAESGLGTFRDLGGIWSQVRLEEVATPEAFDADPVRVHAFYNARRAQAAQAEPNEAHRALGRLAVAGEARPYERRVAFTPDDAHVIVRVGTTVTGTRKRRDACCRRFLATP